MVVALGAAEHDLSTFHPLERMRGEPTRC